MYIDVDRKGTVQGFQYLLKKAENNESVSGILVLACEENAFTPETIDRVLLKCGKPIFGGIFTGIIYNKEKLLRGTIVASICQQVHTITIEDIDDSTNFDELLEHTFEASFLQNKTMFVFVDGLSKYISSLIESMLNCYGLLPNYIGGGAGSIFGEKPCIISEKGLLKDAAVFAVADIKSGIGVAHGWEPVAGPLKVTEADHNTIISLNWHPAFDVYREIVEELSGEFFSNTDFFRLAKEFPFGIAKMAKEMVVRDPIAVDGNGLVCVGEVPLNSLVYILKGNKDSLIAGAVYARELAESIYQQVVDDKNKKPITLIMDCVSRVLFLQSNFKKELEKVYTGYPVLGALTIGEIANTGRNYLEFYNKTSVIGYLEG